MNEIDTLEEVFKKHEKELVNKSYKLSICEVVTDCKVFVNSGLGYCRANSGKKTFLPYYDRLKILEQIIKN